MKHILMTLCLWVSACHGCGDGKGELMPDAAPDAVPQPRFRRSEALNANLYGMALTEDESTLVFCAGDPDPAIGFVDAKTLTVTQKIELRPMIAPELDQISHCRMTLIGSNAYAYYHHESVDTTVVMFRVSLAEKRVTGIWPFSKEQARTISISAFDDFQGVLPTTNPKEGLLTLWRGDRSPGIKLRFVDLETGEFSDRVINTMEDTVEGLNVFNMAGKEKVFGHVYFVNKRGYNFLADLDGNILWKTDPFGDPNDTDIDLESQRIVVTHGLSSGFSILSLETGEVLKHFNYVSGGFFQMARWLPGNRLLFSASSSGGDSYVTLVDADTNKPLAFTNFGNGPMTEMVLSKDRKRAYLGGGGLARGTHDEIIEVTLDE